ncbi:hypothetical protein OIU85_012367 [Salix viminalis]|uniref:Uncharacterized protein n=1 Tax=Salix viminalis TaxID=40686 RepID=A0A9Q0NP54_SALVM|nr:hypothetical protein OIU85_012367 [Salix viminalis]
MAAFDVIIQRSGLISQLGRMCPRFHVYQAPGTPLCISFPNLMAIRKTIILFFLFTFLSSQNHFSAAQKWVKAGYCDLISTNRNPCFCNFIHSAILFVLPSRISTEVNARNVPLDSGENAVVHRAPCPASNPRARGTVNGPIQEYYSLVSISQSFFEDRFHMLAVYACGQTQ